MAVIITQNVVDACTYPSAYGLGDDYVFFLDSTDRKLYKTNKTGSVSGVSSTAVNGNAMTNICTLACGLICGFSSSNTHAFIFNIITGIASDFTTSDAAFVTGNRGQAIAAQPTHKIAYGCCNRNGTLVKFDGNAMTVAENYAKEVYVAANDFISCIIPKGTDSFIYGTSKGTIHEMDIDSKLVKQYSIPDARQVNASTTGTVFNRGIAQLAYYNGYLLAESSYGEVFLFDHDSGVCLQTISINSSASVQKPPVVMSPALGETVLLGHCSNFTHANTFIMQLDMLTTPMTWMGAYWAGASTNPIKNLGFFADALVGVYWAWATIPGQGKLHLYAINTRRSVTYNTYTFQDGLGNPISGDILVIDQDGITAQVMFYTTVPTTGKMVPLTSGKVSLYLVGSSGEGTSKQFDIRQVNS